MRQGRIGCAVLGAAGLGYGVIRLLVEIPFGSLVLLAVWLVAAVVVHDGVIAPGMVGLGWVLRRWVPDRDRRYLQVWLIISGLITVIAVPMIHLQGSFPAQKALLDQDYRVNLAVLIGAAAVAIAAVRLGRRTRSPESGRLNGQSDA